MRYKQKVILVVSETEDDCGRLPLIHGIYTSVMDAENKLIKTKDLPAHLNKAAKLVSGDISFEI